MYQSIVRNKVRSTFDRINVGDYTVFQFLILSWGKVTSVETVEDLHVLERALHIVAEAGEPEALANPITD